MAGNLLSAAMGQVPADLVVTNGQIVNVYTGEITSGGVAVSDGRIIAQGDVGYTVGEETEVIDAAGNYIVPGFIEGHIHPESANLSLPRFAEVVLAHGTTTVFTDLHEIGVVSGVEGMDAALAEGRATPLKFKFVFPSHIPFSPGLETSGGAIDADVIEAALQREDVVGISEVVSQLVAMGLPGLLRSIEATRRAGKVVAGHGPETTGPMWNASAAMGVANDHEALSLDDVLLRVRNGVYAHLRHNLLVPTLPELIKGITEAKLDTRLMCLVTDDTSAITLTDEGHLDYLVRLALSLGVDFVTAIQMVTLNVASSYAMDRELGSLAPGRTADINIVTGPEDFKVLTTIAGGKVVAKDGALLAPVVIPDHDPVLLDTFHLKAPVTAADLVIPAPEGKTAAHVHAMRTLPWIPITEGLEADLAVKDGYVAADLEQDLLHIAVVERHHATGNVGKAFIGGFGLKRGAIASSIAHDNHNIVVMGADPEQMAVAANAVAEMDGGVVLVDGGAVVASIALPLVGLLSDQDAWHFAEDRKVVLAQAQAMGCTVPEPFMFLSFITLAAIPAFAVTDKGYVDCLKQELIDPILGWA
ncbi:MAG: adenine deaminase [Anaerolineae bacterium]|nr:adenine deaminase [Anaerolineae bacterium]